MLDRLNANIAELTAEIERLDCQNPIRGEGGKFEGCAPGEGGGESTSSKGSAGKESGSSSKAAADLKSRYRELSSKYKGSLDDYKALRAMEREMKATFPQAELEAFAVEEVERGNKDMHRYLPKSAEEAKRESERLARAKVAEEAAKAAKAESERKQAAALEATKKGPMAPKFQGSVKDAIKLTQGAGRTELGDETGSQPPKPGEPMMVFRVGGHDTSLAERNGANAVGLVHHISGMQDEENAFGGGGTIISASVVTVDREFGEYQASQGATSKAATEAKKTNAPVGRSADKALVWYSFPPGGAWKQEHVVSFKLEDFEKYLAENSKGEKYGPFTKTGQAGDIATKYLRQYVTKIAEGEVTPKTDSLADIEAALARLDCENPIRGEDGKFEGCAPGSGGGSTSSSKPAATGSKGKTPKPGWMRDSYADKGLASLGAPAGPKAAVARFRVGMKDEHGFAAREHETSREVKTDTNLGGVGADGMHLDDGTIVLSDETAGKAALFATQWKNDPEGVRAKLEKISKGEIKINVDDKLDPNRPLVQNLFGVHATVHETLHGFGPVHTDDKEGTAIAVEEVTTEVATRAYVRDNFGYDMDDALRATNGGRGKGWDLPQPYQPQIADTKRAIADTFGVPAHAAEHVLEAAAVEFKRQPLGKSRTSVLNKRAFLEERLGGATFGKRTEEAAQIRAELAALPDVPKPITMFARTVAATFERGPTGTGALDLKDSEQARKLEKTLDQLWMRYEG